MTYVRCHSLSSRHPSLVACVTCMSVHRVLWHTYAATHHPPVILHWWHALHARAYTGCYGIRTLPLTILPSSFTGGMRYMHERTQGAMAYVRCHSPSSRHPSLVACATCMSVHRMPWHTYAATHHPPFTGGMRYMHERTQDAMTYVRCHSPSSRHPSLVACATCMSVHRMPWHTYAATHHPPVILHWWHALHAWAYTGCHDIRTLPLVILPSSFTGGMRYMHERTQGAMAYVRCHSSSSRHPSLVACATCMSVHRVLWHTYAATRHPPVILHWWHALHAWAYTGCHDIRTLPLTILPSSFTGGMRYMHERTQDAMTYARCHLPSSCHPSLVACATCMSVHRMPWHTYAATHHPPVILHWGHALHAWAYTGCYGIRTLPLVILPSSFTGGMRYMHERTQDAMTYARCHLPSSRHPSLVACVTCMSVHRMPWHTYAATHHPPVILHWWHALHAWAYTGCYDIRTLPLTILPSSFTGGMRYMHERTQDAMTYVRCHSQSSRHPSLGACATCMSVHRMPWHTYAATDHPPTILHWWHALHAWAYTGCHDIRTLPLIILPSSFTGYMRYMHERTQDAMTYARCHLPSSRHPSLVACATCMSVHRMPWHTYAATHHPPVILHWWHALHAWAYTGCHDIRTLPLTILPSSFAGGMRYMHERTQDAMTYVRCHSPSSRHPSLVACATCISVHRVIYDIRTLPLTILPSSFTGGMRYMHERTQGAMTYVRCHSPSSRHPSLVACATCMSVHRVLWHTYAATHHPPVILHWWHALHAWAYTGCHDIRTLQLIILPSSFTGGMRYMHERTQDAMTYVRCHSSSSRHPSLVACATCMSVHRMSWHTYAATVAPISSSLSPATRSGGLCRVHSVGRLPFMPRQRVTTRESLCWADVVYLDCSRFAPTVLVTSRLCGFLRAYTGSRGWDVEMKLFRECRRLFTCWWWWRLCRWSVSCSVRSFWQWTLRHISGGTMPDST